MPRISIIIPTHNRAPLLQRAIESAFAAGDDVEVIVVDDASTDETPVVCAAFPPVRYIRRDQSGRQARARNDGIRESTAPYLLFLDDDDILLPNALNLLADTLDVHPEAALCYGQILLGDGECMPTGELFPRTCREGDVFWHLLIKNFIMVHAAVVRRECCETVGHFEPEYTGVEDWHLWMKLAERWPFATVNQAVGVVRIATATSGQTSSNTSHMGQVTKLAREAGLALPRATAASPAQRRWLRAQVKADVSDSCIFTAQDYLHRGMFKEARSNLLRSFYLSPLRALRPRHVKMFVQSFSRKTTKNLPAG